VKRFMHVSDSLELSAVVCREVALMIKAAAVWSVNAEVFISGFVLL